MKITAYKTHAIQPKESLFDIIDRYATPLPDKSILAITSKILSLSQDRTIPKDKIPDKFKLIQRESDFYLPGDYSEQYGVCLTLKHNILIPTAGIDESNGNDHYILYPENIQAETVKLWQHCRQRHPGKSLGLIITDSHTTPLRRGVTGIGLAWAGFSPLHSYIDKPDIYGRPLKVTLINILDGLAASAVFVMGEGNEQTPMALLEDLDKIHFQDQPPTPEEIQSVSISLKEDLYSPLLTHVDWQRGGGGL